VLRTDRPAALTIAGSDSSGGAGIQADLKTMTVLGVYGASVITAITAQNTRGVDAVELLSPGLVRAQLESVLSDIPIGAIKTGMLGDADMVREVAGVLAGWPSIPLVVDPVMISKSGHSLLSEEGRRAVVEHLLPLATIITPNLHEAEALTGRQITGLDGMEAAARELAGLGPRWVLVKGGHLKTEPADLLWDGQKSRYRLLRGARIDTVHTHGTGCTLASAIASFLALGDPVPVAVGRAKRFITGCIETAWGIGGGCGPVNQLHWLGKAVDAEEEDQEQEE
jgi:hydroxymethylpyrimidine/phosphomethylpyrimidine kinase